MIRSLLIACLLAAAPAPAPAGSPAPAGTPPATIEVDVDPRIELLAVVQLEAAGGLAQLEKGRDRGLGIVEEAVRDRDDVIASAQLPRLFE